MRKILMATAVMAVAACTGHGRTDQQQQTNRLLKDRLWLDHVPTNPRDMAKIFVALSPDGRRRPSGPIGAFAVNSQWEGHFEGFRYEAQDQEMRVVFPQTGEKATLEVTARECHEGDFDYCLDIEGTNHGAKRYYSRKGWDVRGLDEVSAKVTSLQ